MKIYILLIASIICISTSYADSIYVGKSDPNYKNLKVYAKVLNRIENSNFYLAEIVIENAGGTTLSFWESKSSYVWLFDFTAFGVVFMTQDQLNNPQEQSVDDIKVTISPHTKHVIITQFYVFNRERFLETNGNLKLEFHFFDANLNFNEDQMCPKIVSENKIEFNW